MGSGELVDSMLQQGLTCDIAGCHMGATAEEIAARYEISREEQDGFAVESQRRASAAMEAGHFRAEIVPVEVAQRRGPPSHVEQDEHPRPGTTLEGLAGLRPAFKPDGTVTAGNASGINDGAAALVVASESRARELGRAPLARVVSYAAAGVEPMLMGLGPIPAVRRSLDRAGLRPQDVDLFELNEAFAVQSLAVIRELDLDPERVNVNGGAVALGHPLGASGARILTTLLYSLRARSGRYGVATLCIGGGQGIAVVIECSA
jgi:acetyl-CoA C-acetyltransferase